MRLIFAKRASVGSWAIRWFQWSRWSHVALHLADGSIIDSTFAHGGVRIWRAADWLRQYPVREVVDVPLPREDLAEAWARAQVGKSYDWRALLGHLFRSRRWRDDDAWFCSEIAARACEVGGLQLVPHDADRVTPETLYVAARAHAMPRC